MERYNFRRWFCPNCSELIVVSDGEDNKVSARCRKCGVLMIKTHLNHRHDIIELRMPHRNTYN